MRLLGVKTSTLVERFSSVFAVSASIRFGVSSKIMCAFTPARRSDKLLLRVDAFSRALEVEGDSVSGKIPLTEKIELSMLVGGRRAGFLAHGPLGVTSGRGQTGVTSGLHVISTGPESSLSMVTYPFSCPEESAVSIDFELVMLTETPVGF